MIPAKGNISQCIGLILLPFNRINNLDVKVNTFGVKVNIALSHRGGTA